MSLLLVQGAAKRFGGVQALNAVSFSIAAGEIFGLIGPNGAGKTTLFNVLTGIYPADAGSFTFNARSLAGLKPNHVAGAGIAEHLHIHVVPRWTGDVNFMPAIAQTSVIPEALKETAAKLRAALAENQ